MLLLLLLSRFSRVDSMRPHRQQPTRLLHPWDFPGKSTGVGCHILALGMLLKHAIHRWPEENLPSPTDSREQILQSLPQGHQSKPLGTPSPLSKAHRKLKRSVQFSRSVMSNSLRPYGPQHARPPCPSPAPWAYSNSCPLSRWCHPTISSSVVPFSFCLQSFPASGSFPMSQFFASDGQRIGVSASASILPMNIQDWFPLGWTGWISFQSKGLSRVFPNTTVQKHQFFSSQLSLQSNSHNHTYYWKNHSFD